MTKIKQQLMIQLKNHLSNEQAEKWKDKIDERAYEALMKYEVNIDD